MIVFLLLVVVACTSFTPEQDAFQSACTSAFGPGAWMKMKSMKNGVSEGSSCWGCMVNMDTHVCSMEELKSFEG